MSNTKSLQPSKKVRVIKRPLVKKTSMVRMYENHNLKLTLEVTQSPFIKSPEKVELFENNTLKLELLDSSKGSLNGIKGVQNRTYNGKANKARIYGEAGSMVTFYDDQQFRKGQNYVTIIKLTDDPIEVTLNKNFVDKTEEAGDEKIYMPDESLTENSSYKWIFVKRVKSNFFGRLLETIIPFVDWEDIKKVLKFIEGFSDEIPYFKTVTKQVLKTSSNNYRVDNCSSVEFGEIK